MENSDKKGNGAVRVLRNAFNGHHCFPNSLVFPLIALRNILATPQGFNHHLTEPEHARSFN